MLIFLKIFIREQPAKYQEAVFQNIETSGYFDFCVIQFIFMILIYYTQSEFKGFNYFFSEIKQKLST